LLTIQHNGHPNARQTFHLLTGNASHKRQPISEIHTSPLSKKA